MSEQELSFKGTTECVKSATEFGKNLYYNICTGESTYVPWGGADWLGFITLFGLLGTFAFFLGFVAIQIARD